MRKNERLNQSSNSEYVGQVPEFKRNAKGNIVRLMRENGEPVLNPHKPGEYAYVPSSEEEMSKFLAPQETSIDVSGQRVEELRLAEQEAAELVEHLRNERQRAEQEFAEKEEEERQRVLRAQEAERQRAVETFLAGRRKDLSQPIPSEHSNTESSWVADTESTPSKIAFLQTKRGKVLAGSALVATLGTASWVGLDGAKMNPFNSTEAAADTHLSEFDKDAEISAAAFDVDNCFADDGTGTPLFSGDIAFTDWVNWPVVKTDKSVTHAALLNDTPEYAPAGKEDAETRKPVVTAETAIDYAACVPEADAGTFLRVDNDTVTVDLSKATSQFAFRKDGTSYVVEQFELAEFKNKAGDIIVTKEAAVATVAASQDETVIASLIDMAKTKAAGVISKADGEYAEQMKVVTDAYKTEITEEINQQAAAFYEKSGQPAEELEIKIEGELKSATLEYKGNAPKASDKVSLADEVLKITQFNPIAK